MALFADCLDHLEWKTYKRVDGNAMSIYNIIAVAMVGIIMGVFNWMLAESGYVPPMEFKAVAETGYPAFAEAASIIASQGLTPQTALDSIEPVKDVYTVAFQQPAAVGRMITLAFVGIEVFTGIILAVILKFVNVEKTIDREQAEIKARHAAKAETPAEEA